RCHRPPFHDQSALNALLHDIALPLDERFNSVANMRKHWPALCLAPRPTARLVHFVDYPKPWDFLGEFIHPPYRLWRSALERTAFKRVRSWHTTPSRKLPKTRKAWAGYRKALRDRILFAGYRRGWFKKVKGVPLPATRQALTGPAL